MTVEQKRLLDKRLREHAVVQPDIRELKRTLLRLGGCHLVAPPTRPDGNVLHLIRSGFIMQGPVVMKRMDRNSCHQNASKLWIERKHGVVAIGTGYALDHDGGLWRQHTWGITRIGSIVETTYIQEKYFGVVFWAELADYFAKAQYEASGLPFPLALDDSDASHPPTHKEAKRELEEKVD
jgi:hypothetical protein